MADKSMNGRFNVLRRRTSEIIHILHILRRHRQTHGLYIFSDNSY